MTVWHSSGHHLLATDPQGRLRPTAEFLRAYLRRPELAPVEESCAAERSLHAALYRDPLQPVTPVTLLRLKDADARENWSHFVTFRDLLQAHETLESAYRRLIGGGASRVPPLFVEHLTHVIVAQLCAGQSDPYRLRAAECLFRTQKVRVVEGRILAADEEIVAMHAKGGTAGGLGRFLEAMEAPLRPIGLDVLGPANQNTYAARADRFETVLDLSFGAPGLDGLCRVLERWVRHFLDVEVSIQPTAKVRDERWAWHVGLDAEASAMLDALYAGQELPEARHARLLSLFRLEVRDPGRMPQSLAGRPIYMAMAMEPDGRMKLKPQNLLVNLPLNEMPERSTR